MQHSMHTVHTCTHTRTRTLATAGKHTNTYMHACKRTHTHTHILSHTHMSGPSGSAHQQVVLVNSLRHELGPVLPVVCACCPHSLRQQSDCFRYIESLHCQVADRPPSYCLSYTEPMHNQVAVCQHSDCLRRSEPLATRWLNVSNQTV